MTREEQIEQAAIDKACEWLKDNIENYYCLEEGAECFVDMIENFKNAMEK